MPSEKTKIKAIIFDLGGVVMHGGYLDFIKNYCLACLTPAGQGKIEMLERQVDLGNVSETEFYREIKKVFGVDLTPKQMHDLITGKMKRDEELIKFIPKLKQSKVALLTNSIGHMAVETLRKRKVPAKKLFDKVFVSSDLHLVKPDTEAYEYVLKKMKVKPSESLMVDDRLENIAGAQKIGMHGLVYKDFDQFRKDIEQYEFI